VGTVSEAPPLNSEKNAGLYREGTVAPAADLNDLRELFILTGSTSAKK
jgi:cell shape-determining protein MreC